MSLEDEAKRIAKSFEVSSDTLARCVRFFQLEMQIGLSREGSDLSQLPTYVTKLPSGKETVRYNLCRQITFCLTLEFRIQGTYLAIDLGGTNLRVCSVELHGDHTFTLKNSHLKVPEQLKDTPEPHLLFAFIAEQIKDFLSVYHGSSLETVAIDQSSEKYFDLGFTFSFPVYQYGINKGLLMRWTKGFNIREAVGQDVCSLLQKEIDTLRLPVKISALVNDTVGTLMARCYTKPGRTNTLIGAIFGTGTNGAYVEELSKIKKIAGSHTKAERVSRYEDKSACMVVNTEWGSFDNSLKVLPTTVYDTTLDEESINPGFQMFEKRISGLFLGEILRRVVLKLHLDHDRKVFCPETISDNKNSVEEVRTDDFSPLFKAYAVDSSVLSTVESDTSPYLTATKQALSSYFQIANATREECAALKILVHAIGTRAVRLSAVALGAILLSSDALHVDGGVDLGVDGSLAEHYPEFEKHLREALREIDGIGDAGEQKITIGRCEDGSGLGAALAALMARKAEDN